MAKNLFEVEVYTNDDRLFQFDWTLEQMVELLKNLRDYSFIRLSNEYINKMHINSISFESPELLNDLWNYINGSTLNWGKTWYDIQKKYTVTSDFEEKFKN